MTEAGITAQFDDEVPADPLRNPQAELDFLIDLAADNRLIDPAADRLRPVDFSVQLYGMVFSKMIELSAGNLRADAVTMAPFFHKEDGWDRLNGFLAGAHLNAGPRARTKAYLEQVRDLARRRRMVTGLQEVTAAARDGEVSVDTLITLADEAVAELADEQTVLEQAPAGEYAQQVIESFGKPIIGVRCGVISSLDAAIGTLRMGEVAIGGGRPGMGKTATACSYLVGAASLGHPVLFFSLEMSADEITRRILADMCYSLRGGVPYEAIRDGTVKGSDFDAVVAAKRRLDSLPIEISDRAGLTLAMISRRVRRHKRRLVARGQKLALVIIDYLQLIAAGRSGVSPYEHASEVSKGLKALAKDEGVAVLALAQLSREVEKRTDKRPIPSDLRDSGQIEQDADVIFFLYREEEYLRRNKPADEFGMKFDEWRTEMDAARNRIEFIVPKRRSGSPGASSGWFFGEFGAVRGADFYRMGEEDDYRG